MNLLNKNLYKIIEQNNTANRLISINKTHFSDSI
jgi:hypothetical protein